MPHLTLYRKWRPQRFEDVIGQAHVVRTLTNALAQGRTAHAYLFAGPRGTGKTTLARLLAKGLNCEQGPTPAPCNRCPSCVQITEGSALDVMEIDGASNRGIDEIRELRDRIRYAPARSRYKVYIIDEVHMLTNEAFNALLKMLEEPPAHVVFIFATTEPQRVPATILSRCQRFDFRRLSPEELTAHLAAVARAEGLSAEPAALQLIARHADGGARDALSMLEQCMAYEPKALDVRTVAEVLGLVRPEALGELALCLVEGKVGEGLQLLQHLIGEEGVDSRLVLKDLLGFLRDVATHKMLGGRASSGSPFAGRVEELARRAPMTRLVAAMEALLAAEPQMRWAPDPRVVLELALMRLACEAAAPAAPPGPQPPAAAAAAAPSSTGATPEPSPAASTMTSQDAHGEPRRSPPGAEHARRAGTSSRGAARRAAPLTLDEVMHRWDDVLAALRNQQHPNAAKAEAFLREARPIRVTDLEVIVGFPPPKAFLSNMLEADVKARDQAGKVLSRLFGRPVSVRAEVIDGEAAGAGSAPQPVPPRPGHPERDEVAAALEATPPPPPSSPPTPAPGPASPAAASGGEPPAAQRPPATSRIRPRPGSGAGPAPAANGARQGADDEFDQATLDAVLQILGARIIKEFDEADLEERRADDAHEAGEAGDARDGAGRLQPVD